MKESDIQREILNTLEQLKIWAWRNFNGPIIAGGTRRRAKNPAAGSPDILGYMPCGRGLAIEVKADGKAKISDIQKAWIRRAVKNNVLAFIAVSGEEVWDEIKNACENCLISDKCAKFRFIR